MFLKKPEIPVVIGSPASRKCGKPVNSIQNKQKNFYQTVILSLSKDDHLRFTI
jgi:hypothetical protein